MKLSELMKTPLTNLWTMRVLELVLRRLYINKDDLILEIGCGNGFTTFILSTYAKEVVSIDLSEPLIQFLDKQPKPNNIRFMVGDATKKSPDIFLEAFDKFICIDVLEHVENPLATLEYIHQVLKPGGAAAITFPVRKPEHGRNHFNLEDVHNLFAKVDMRAEIKIFKHNWFGSSISTFYRGLQNLLEPPIEADTFDKLKSFEMLTIPKKIHRLYKLGAIFLFKISSNSYKEDEATGRRALVITEKE